MAGYASDPDQDVSLRLPAQPRVKVMRWMPLAAAVVLLGVAALLLNHARMGQTQEGSSITVPIDGAPKQALPSKRATYEFTRDPVNTRKC